MLQKLNEEIGVRGLRRLKTRSRECLRTGGDFVVEDIEDKRLYRHRNFEAGMVLAAVNRHNQINAHKKPGLLKSTSKSVLTVFSLPGGSDDKIYVKEFSNRGLIRWLETVFYVHRGKRAWKAGRLLQILGVPSAELIALVEKRRLGFPQASYLLMKEIKGAEQLNKFLLRNYFLLSGRLSHEQILEKRRLIRIASRALQAFHSRHIYHKDLSAKNLLLEFHDNATTRFYCVDTDSIDFPWRLSLRRRIKNLAQLNGLPGCVTTADRIRFYKDYFGMEKLTPLHKFFIRIIRRLSRRRMQHARWGDERFRKELTA